MRTFHRILAAAVTLLCTAALPAQQTQRLTADRHNEYGLVYSLPMTSLSVNVTAVKTVERAGKYRQYAAKCLGIDNVVAEDRTRWEITGVSVTPFGVAYDDNQYLMQLKPGASTFISVDDNGMLLAINTDADAPEAPETGTAVVSSTQQDNDADEYLQYVNEDFLASQSSLKQAQMLAESIMEVRDAKIALTRGTADNMPTDGKQLELMLASLRRQEESMTRVFTGDVYTEQINASFTFTPGEDGRTVLTRVSDYDGFTDADDYAGEPLYISVKETDKAELPTDEKGEVKKLPRDAVMYTIPGRAQVSLTWRGKTIWSGEFDMAQYGVQFGLNPSLFTDRKNPSYVIFDTATGGVRKIGQVSDLGK